MKGIGRVLTLDEIAQKTVPILQRFGVTRATLFGSYAKGIADERSDIDLVIETDRHGFAFTEILAELFKEFGYGNVDLYAEYELEEGDPLTDEIQKTGVMLYAEHK